MLVAASRAHARAHLALGGGGGAYTPSWLELNNK